MVLSLKTLQGDFCTPHSLTRGLILTIHNTSCPVVSPTGHFFYSKSSQAGKFQAAVLEINKTGKTGSARR